MGEAFDFSQLKWWNYKRCRYRFWRVRVDWRGYQPWLETVQHYAFDEFRFFIQYGGVDRWECDRQFGAGFKTLWAFEGWKFQRFSRILLDLARLFFSTSWQGGQTVDYKVVPVKLPEPATRRLINPQHDSHFNPIIFHTPSLCDIRASTYWLELITKTG